MEILHMKKRELTLTKLFWHYLLTVGISFVCLLVTMVFTIAVMVWTGLVLPANTAEAHAKEVENFLTSGELTMTEVPAYYRWACFDEAGQMTEHAEFSRHRQEQIRMAAQTEKTVISDFPFSQYHRFIYRPDGSLCVLQYDFSMPYTIPWMERFFPDCQILMAVIFLTATVLMIIYWTKSYARKLHRDTLALTAATQAIMDQRLDTPFQHHTNVREFGEILQAMDLLRSSLASSLHEQWSMEQQRTREIAALTHDLKTPLTVISGNSELLAEENLSAEQQNSVEAILRNAQRMESYLSQLRIIVAQQEHTNERDTVELQALFSEWVTMGEELCASKQIRLIPSEAPQKTCELDAQGVNRAVQNLLDNAARYTPQGGEIHLSARIEDDLLSIAVQDGGSGFTEEAMAHGCEAFFTENQSRQGTGHVGMGLYQVQCVAHRHHGKVTISNTEAGGVVTLQLRLAE